MAITDFIEYLESSPPVFVTVFWMSCALLASIICLMLGIALSRVAFLIRERHRKLLASQWLPVFNAARAGIPCEIPRLSNRSRTMLLEQWVEYRQLLNDEQGFRLDDLARYIDLGWAIKKILRPALLSFTTRPVWQQNVALAAVHWLHDKPLMRYVYEAAGSGNLHVAVSACHCLTSLKAPGYEQEVVALLFRFPSHSAFIATELSQAGSKEILQLMEPFIDDMPPNMATNFVALADKSNDREVLPLLIRRLLNSREGREIAILVRTLGRLGDSTHRNLVAQFLQDERYYIRIQAIKALGRIGQASDVRLLTPFLSDREWWVRYRTARAIIRLLKKDAEAIKRLISELDDRFARDILNHAHTEMNWCLN